jgi:hypothetical protein
VSRTLSCTCRQAVTGYACVSCCVLCCWGCCRSFLPHKLDPLHLKLSTQTYAPSTYRGHQAGTHSWPEVGLVREFEVRPAAGLRHRCVPMHPRTASHACMRNARAAPSRARFNLGCLAQLLVHLRWFLVLYGAVLPTENMRCIVLHAQVQKNEQQSPLLSARHLDYAVMYQRAQQVADLCAECSTVLAARVTRTHSHGLHASCPGRRLQDCSRPQARDRREADTCICWVSGLDLLSPTVRMLCARPAHHGVQHRVTIAALHEAPLPCLASLASLACLRSAALQVWHLPLTASCPALLRDVMQVWVTGSSP